MQELMAYTYTDREEFVKKLAIKKGKDELKRMYLYDC